MKVSTLLTAMALLVGAAGAPHVNLNTILDVIPKLNQSSTQNYFVEDLTHLAEGVKCGDAFFCRVYDILEHGNFSKLVVEEKKLEKNLEEEKILKENEAEMIKRNLKQYIGNRNVTCSLVLKGMKTSNISEQVSEFWKKISSCIRTRNFRGHK